MNYERVNWQNGAETPLNQTNLNKMDKAISDLVSELEKLKQIEILGAFPNQSNCCISNCVNFSSASGFSVTYGEIATADGKLIVSSREYASTQLKAKLNKSIILNEDRNILVKLRIKAVEGSNCGIDINIGLTDGVTVSVANSCIKGSSLAGHSLTVGEWTDLWWIFGAEEDTEIDSIVLNLYTYPKIEISNLQAFYSLDKNGGAGAIIIDSDATVESTTYHTTVTNADPEATATTYTELEEGEI